MSATFISVKYDDADPATYQGLLVWSASPYREERSKDTFNFGHGATIDFMVAALVLPFTSPFMCGSSVDHFIMDGGDFNPDGDPPYTDDQWALAKELATQWRATKEKTDAESP